ncbi:MULTISPECIES: DUF4116 domain-containing protein [unclassified Marinobacterium]|uniref:DUF4116 domain-containing protein n=1 Tax=unclassified Marinobacterium TaxID=2644139 RepID=UPI001569178D|nr:MULTISPECIES: DUF4116 domain-containing protein [unclassified Marinobacterium]NRP10104.1 hypothetical protein [Marinobacterium sp. xm-g-48]NRP82949.1 hypothetical protein [Marinobacterium sp. xm-d-509]
MSSWKKNGFLRLAVYVLLALGLTYLSDNYKNWLGKTALYLWVVLVGYVVIFEVILPKFRKSQHTHKNAHFWGRQYAVMTDPETSPTHSYDPEFNYIVLSETESDEQYSGTEEILHPENLIQPSDELLQKLKNDESITASEFISLVSYSDQPSMLFQRLIESDQSDRNVIKAGVTNMGTFLRYVPEVFQDDPEIVDLAVKNGCNAFDFASTRLRSDKEKWAEVWPEMRGMLFDKNFSQLTDNDDSLIFWDRLIEVMAHEGFDFAEMNAGDVAGFFGNGFTQTICHYKHVYVETPEGQKAYDPSSYNGENIFVERLVRIYFKFITNGNFDDQPFIRMTHQIPGSAKGFDALPKGSLIDLRWYDNYTHSDNPTVHPVFFARLCWDIKGFLPNFQSN